MTVSPFGSTIYKGLFSDEEISSLFTDQAHIKSLIKVEMALAKVQGEQNIIPAEASENITSVLNDLSIKPEELTDGTTKDGVVVPTLVKKLREAVGGDNASYIHYGVTSQDIIDTALVLQIKSVIDIYEKRISDICKSLATLADVHRGTIMAARTRSQISTPTTFGLKAANWLMPLIRHQQRLSELKGRLLILSLGGASGTLSAINDEEAILTAKGLKEELGLDLPPLPWHNQRDNIGELSSFCALLTGSIAKIASDIIFLSASGINELSITGGGASSTMPQKNNPVLAEAIVALNKTNIALSSGLISAQIHNQERDASAWQIEWMTVPQCLNITGTCLNHIALLLKSIKINEEVMIENMDNTHGTILAEAASYLLTQQMSKAEAQKIVAEACQKAITEKTHLFDILARETDTYIEWETEKNYTRHIGLNDKFIDHTLNN
ncbi:MAG: adenylosuccinate lyase family protein [Kordiimonadaceae bacterium]|jgi:3-carboxy-cis,cis-muconate cycloisomerase|nr:adenylosuccinate lyase family protein [Kordiimonadaceae bacterium]